jgi:hypothetical protein
MLYSHVSHYQIVTDVVNMAEMSVILWMNEWHRIVSMIEYNDSIYITIYYLSLLMQDI